ncbi:MAG: MFS transporter [Sphingomonadaceae bacterium]|nr:MFS transporter [Sphingomonadaceae bacterium]
MAGYRTIALTVSTAVFMQFLDATALNTALPAMGRDLHVPVVNLNVAILAYQLSLAAFIPVGNIAADRIGARRAFAASLGLFLAGSLLCALSHTLPALVASRALQGLGGAVMMPVSRQLVIRSAAKHELVSAMNWLLIPGIVGPLLGPVVGGFIVTYANWHWIFLINLPVALIGIALTLALVPDDGTRVTDRIDGRGVLLVAATVICLIFGLEGLSHPRVGVESVALLFAGLMLGWLYVRHAAGNPGAALDLSLLDIESFRHSMMAGSILRMVVVASGFLFPLWFQLAMGMTPAQSGMLVVASTCGALMSRFLSGTLMRGAHPRRIAMAGTVCVVIALLLTSSLRPGFPRSWFVAALFTQGLASSIPLMIISAVAYVDVAAERLGAATGFYTTIQQLTLSLGVTAGVWTIGAMRWFAGSGASDGITYEGGLAMLAGLAALAIYATARLSHDSLGALRPREATA